MKKTIIFFILNLIFLSAFSQNFDILKEDGTTVVSNDTVTISSTKNNSDFSELFSFRNNTSNNEEIKVLFNYDSLVSHSTYGFCWDHCYSNSFNGFSSDTISVDANSISTSHLSIDYSPSGNYGTSIFKYSFICDAIHDTIFVVVKFIIENNSSLNQIDNNKLLIYPNPCNQSFRIKNLSDNKIESIHLFNILGNKIKIESDEQKIYDTKSLSNGLYLLKISYKN